MDVNALNYCRFSLLPLRSDSFAAFAGGGTPTAASNSVLGGARALLAVPNLVESSLVCCYLPFLWVGRLG